MAAYMGRNVGHLLPEDLVVPVHHMVESMFPVHSNQRHTIGTCQQQWQYSLEKYCQLAIMYDKYD